VQFFQSRCNLMPQVQILIREDLYFKKLIFCSFLLAQTEGENFSFIQRCIVFSMDEMPGSQISAAGNFFC
jgi:hypothetical protein